MFSRIKQSGFTLVEIVIVISIMGIIGGLSTLIIGRSLDSYAALERRENLQTSVRLAVERISRELRNALPNSICINNGGACINGSGSGFYFIPVKDSGRYQDKSGNYISPPPIKRDRLPVNNPSRDRFDILSTNGSNRITAITNDWVVVYNQNNTDIYTAPNNIRHQINTIVQKDIKNTGANLTDDIDQVQFTGNVTFSNHSPTRRFHIIDNNEQVTSFSFSLVNNSLFRETTTLATPITGGSANLLMQNVQACSFTFTPGAPQRAGLLRINITVAENGETIQVIHEAHVYNTP